MYFNQVLTSIFLSSLFLYSSFHCLESLSSLVITLVLGSSQSLRLIHLLILLGSLDEGVTLMVVLPCDDANFSIFVRNESLGEPESRSKTP